MEDIDFLHTHSCNKISARTQWWNSVLLWKEYWKPILYHEIEWKVMENAGIIILYGTATDWELGMFFVDRENENKCNRATVIYLLFPTSISLFFSYSTYNSTGRMPNWTQRLSIIYVLVLIAGRLKTVRLHYSSCLDFKLLINTVKFESMGREVGLTFQ